MKIAYWDNPKEAPYFLEDQPECKIRAVFHDDGDIYVFYSHDPSSQLFINKIINKTHIPHIFFLSNLEPIFSEEQFNYYYERLTALSNYQGLHKGEDLDGSEGDTGVNFSL